MHIYIIYLGGDFLIGEYFFLPALVPIGFRTDVFSVFFSLHRALCWINNPTRFFE